MSKAVKIIVGLIVVGFTCTALSDGNPIPLVVMAGVGWVVWQVGRGLGGV